MLYTEEAVRDNIRNREGRRVFYLGKGDTLTPGARDWLQRERVEILSPENAKPQRYLLPGGGFLEEKPEHMTHLNAEVLVPKTHPRIIFRGAMDTLEAELILAQQAAPLAAAKLEEILSLARKILRCDVLNEPLSEKTLCGLSESELRQRSHFPQAHYGIPHFMPSAADGKAMARLNRARCAAREAELRACDAFSDREGNPTRPDILKALNRMSSMLYLLMLEEKSSGTKKL
jgi:ethanolamine utilization cobalamin adenosyltransferase